MKVSYRILFCILLVIMVYGISSRPWYRNLQAQVRQQTTVSPGKQGPRVIRDNAEKQRVKYESLKKGMVMLRQYGLKFDPSLLTLENWRELLKDDLDSMPELKRDWYARGKIEGVIIADNLYLDEYVEATGDTFILARNIISEGTNPTIVTKGHDLYYYPIESGTMRRVIAVSERTSRGYKS